MMPFKDRRQRVSKLRIKRPDIVVSRRASREAIDTQLDLEVMLAAAVVEQARYFREVGGRFLVGAKHAFASGRAHFEVPYEGAAAAYSHAARVAHVLAATRVLGRARIDRKSVV